MLGSGLLDHETWVEAKGHYVRSMEFRRDPELGATFFNSVTRRVFDTIGVDEDIEFAGGKLALSPVGPSGDDQAWLVSIPLPEDPAELIRGLLRDRRFQATWRDLHGDVRLGADALRDALEAGGIRHGSVDVLVPTFYRGQGAYVLARISDGGEPIPLVLAIQHARRGLYLGAVLTDPDDVSVLFSYTHSEFAVRVPDPGGMVRFIRTLIPHRRPAEIYTALGFRKHGKTELYRDLAEYIEQTTGQFTYAPGIRGLVMIVFALDGFDMVFKVIRDHFPPQKTVTPAEVREKYAIVSRHDRAGRLIDAQEFRGLTFPLSRFAPDLLAELVDAAGRTVTASSGVVRFERVYVERRVVPLDVFIREHDQQEAAAAIIDYGTAIKNLAATNIFPGDMLIKNFGVTRQGRVVFYDYDELSLLSDCKFRAMPVSFHPDDDLAETPWFGVGKGDVFPEEFSHFLGVSPELRRAFEERHGDLYDVTFWQRIQDRIRGGETIEIFPYRRQVALHRKAHRTQTIV